MKHRNRGKGLGGLSDGTKKGLAVAGGTLVGLAALAAIFWPRSASAAEADLPPLSDEVSVPPGPPGETPEQLAARKEAARQAKIAADAATATLAINVVGPAASTAVVLATEGWATPYVATGLTTVTAMFNALPQDDKANIWNGRPPSARGAAAAGVTAGTAPPSDTGTAGYFNGMPLNEFHGMPPGLHQIDHLGLFHAAQRIPTLKQAARMLQWFTKTLLKVVKRLLVQLRDTFCKAANKVYAALKAKGASVPKQKTWNNLSCDQKIGFIAALGPYGAAMLVAGALVGGFATNAAGEMKKYGKGAAKAVNKIAKKLGGSATKLSEKPSDWAKAADKYNPF